MNLENCSDDYSDENDTDERESGEDEDEAESLRNELADIPLGEVQKLKESVGLKKYNEAVFGSWRKKELSTNLGRHKDDGCPKHTSLSSNKRSHAATAKEINVVKSKKSEPEERSSKDRKFQPRKVVDIKRRVKRDPRFDDLSGKYNETLFEKSYGFLNDIRNDELSSVKKQLKKTKNVEKKADLHKLLKRMEQQKSLQETTQQQKEKKHARKSEQLGLIKTGRKVFHLKKSDQKKIELAEKFKMLKDTGKFEKYMSKKNKRNASKEKRNLPLRKL